MKKIQFYIVILFTLVINFPSFGLDNSSQQILDTYGNDDLSSKPAFKGGYINFGYWKNISFNISKISDEERIRASFELYELIVNQLNINKQDNVLEIGSGLGNGCSYVATHYYPNSLTCIDMTPEQISRAKNIHQDIVKNNQVEFIVASADNIPKESDSYTKIYSVEVAQYFPSISNFAKEAYRLLKPEGLLVITAHFSTSETGYNETKKLLPTVAQNIDRMIPIEEVRKSFTDAKFKEIKFEAIGKDVFKGFDMWIDQINDVPWAHNLYKLYQEGHIDYYVIILQK